VAAAEVCAGVVFHEYVYGAVPPVAVAVAAPLLPLKQFTWLPTKVEALRAAAG
jgi:hypothetical protein